MKSLLAFVGLLAFVAVAVMAYLNLEESKKEKTIIGWSNSLVWRALQTQTAPNFLNQRLQEAESKDHWQVSGELAYREQDGAFVQRAYRAISAQTCALPQRRECWILASLEVDRIAIVLDALNREIMDAVQDGAVNEDPDNRETTEPPDQSPTVEAAAPDGSDATNTSSAPDLAPVFTEAIDEKTLVLRIQERLIALGFDPGSPDGQLGPKTTAAIRAYQASQGLTEEETPSFRLLRNLEGR